MTSPSPHSWTVSAVVYRPGELGLPRWTYVAWLVFRRSWAECARPTLPRRVEDEIEARRRARMLRDVVPQDAVEPLAA
jgi:hypothetical protein